MRRRSSLDEYVNELEPETQQIFRLAEAIDKENEDTLSEDFQIAAAILKIFWKRAEQSKGF